MGGRITYFCKYSLPNIPNMLSRNNISFIRSLHNKKFRQEHRQFIAEGTKVVNELLDSSFVCKGIYAIPGWMPENPGYLKHCTEVSEEELGKISALVTPQEVLAVFEIPENTFNPGDCFSDYTVFLDGIRDPGNMGTIIRIADWFGIERIVCTPDCAEVWNPKVVQATMGSVKRVKMIEVSSNLFFNELQQYALAHQKPMPLVYGTFMNSRSLYQTTFSANGIIIIGNEANGIRKETEQFIRERITIPPYPTNKTDGPESLNAGIALAVVLSELRRR